MSEASRGNDRGNDLFEQAADGSLILRLHVQPGAGRTAVVGRHGDALKIRVAAPPTQGRANDACLALVAATLGVGGDAVELTGGASSRSKRVRVRGVDADDARRLLAAADDTNPAARPGPADRQASGNVGAIRDVR